MATQAAQAKVGWPVGRIASLSLAIALIVAASALSYVSQQNLLSAGRAVDHTRKVLYEIERFLSLAKDVGTGVRGYLLTGNDEFLEPYKTAAADLPASIATMRSLTADSPSQQRRLDALEPLIADRLARVERQLEAGRTQGEAALTVAESEAAKVTMDGIRSIAAAMTVEETNLDRIRTEAVREGARLAGYPVLAGTLLSLGVIAVLFVQMHGEVGRRRRAEGALRDLNVSLEQSVRERTAQLISSEERYRQVVDLIQEGIWIHVDGRIVFANPYAVQMFGAKTQDELIGRPIMSLVHPDERARAAERTRIVTSESGTVPLTEMQLLKLDGQRMIVAQHATRFAQGSKVHVLVAGRDVTAQHDAEALLRQAQKMDSVGQLTGGIAHDFNNLLTVVIGGLDLVLDRVQGEVRPLVEGSLRAAERGAALVRQLLAFARRQTLVPETLRFNDLAAGMVDLLRRTLGEDVEIELRLDPALWPTQADKSQVENALLNLAINSRDAMPAGGKLTIETANIHLDEDYAAHNAEVAAGDYVMLAVTDTGSGMPPEVAERAFEPFFTTKDQGKGTGLGLSMIYGFAKQSRGHLKIYSEVGHGTTVRLYLPRLSGAGAAATAPAPVPVPHSRGGETILVVEDEADVRTFVVSQLRDLGYRVIEAADGPQAQNILESDQPIDLLLTDVVMPGGITGRRLAEGAKLARPNLRTLFTSGYTENSIVHQGKLDPGVNFLSKPFRRQDLSLKVREALDGPP
jgi:PAS domain S-box-containing protein